MEQREQLKVKTTYQGKTLRERLALLSHKPGYNISNGVLGSMQKHVERISKLGDKLPPTEVPRSITWLNTKDDQPWSFSSELKGKFVVVDFWSSCCINCIHVLAEMDRLEELYQDFPEVAFVGCHSAKFENEKDLHMLRQAVIRYDIKHAVINDNEFAFWRSQGVNCWPTVMVFSPDTKPLFKVTGEGCEESVGALLRAGLQKADEQMHESEGRDDDWAACLQLNQVPLELEKSKHLAQQNASLAQGGSSPLSPEAILALRQNMLHPGKLITVRASQDQPALPYERVSELLIVADSSNNRYLIFDADTNQFLEQIGNGRIGYVEGAFADAEFYHTQGLCHFVNAEGQHCLMLCDVKNHLVREANLNTKQVRHISGVKGERGHDMSGGRVPANKQELASPWDIIKSPTGEFIIAMAGTHQIWSLDTRSDRCERFSGSGGEGNANSRPQTSTWSQPSGISAGPFNGSLSFFIADSESSAIRAIDHDTEKACNVVGANSDTHDLFDFGDTEGKGYSAKLQHPLGVHYCGANKTLYVADTYNHKIKTMTAGTSGLTRDTSLLDFVGTSTDKNARVQDGTGGQARLNEPNGCWARTTAQGEFAGLYVADTGNDCIRFVQPNGKVETLEMHGVPDVRLTAAANCSGGVCRLDGNSGAQEEEKKE